MYKKMRKTMKRKTMKRKSTKRKTMNKFKGGHEIPNYGLNTWQHDPNYMQISSRNIMQHGSGKRKTKKGGSIFNFASGNLSNPIGSFFTNSGSWFASDSNNAPYIQPIGVRQYTSP